MSTGHSMICYDCHRLRANIAAPVIEILKAPRKVAKGIIYNIGDKIVVGWRCKKCVQKLYVGGASKSTESEGWRRRFNELVDQVRNAQIRKQNDAIAKAQQATIAPAKKQTMVNKIASFFRRRAA